MDQSNREVPNRKPKSWMMIVGILLLMSIFIVGAYMFNWALSSKPIQEDAISTENNEQQTATQTVAEPMEKKETQPMMEKSMTMMNLPETETEVTATIYAYSGDVYKIEGLVEQYLTEPGSTQVSMEIHGTMERQDAEEVEQAVSVTAGVVENVPVSITVYTPEGQIYGFQTYYDESLAHSYQENQMELYGHLVGYYDGENYHS